jgi:hypothetical protein
VNDKGGKAPTQRVTYFKPLQKTKRGTVSIITWTEEHIAHDGYTEVKRLRSEVIELKDVALKIVK